MHGYYQQIIYHINREMFSAYWAVGFQEYNIHGGIAYEKRDALVGYTGNDALHLDSDHLFELVTRERLKYHNVTQSVEELWLEEFVNLYAYMSMHEMRERSRASWKYTQTNLFHDKSSCSLHCLFTVHHSLCHVF